MSFPQLIDRGNVDLIQPDVTRCGGITELLRIAELARERRSVSACKRNRACRNR